MKLPVSFKKDMYVKLLVSFKDTCVKLPLISGLEYLMHQAGFCLKDFLTSEMSIAVGGYIRVGAAAVDMTLP